MVSKKEVGIEQQIIKIHGICLKTTKGINLVKSAHFGQFCGCIIRRNHGIIEVFIRTNQAVFGIRNTVIHYVGFINFIIQTTLFHDASDE